MARLGGTSFLPGPLGRLKFLGRSGRNLITDDSINFDRDGRPRATAATESGWFRKDRRFLPPGNFPESDFHPPPPHSLVEKYPFQRHRRRRVPHRARGVFTAEKRRGKERLQGERERGEYVNYGIGPVVTQAPFQTTHDGRSYCGTPLVSS